jgi:hypothetical protein
MFPSEEYAHYTEGFNPSEKLEGLKLKNGWVVTKRLDLSAETTGGRYFSVAYRVSHSDGSQAFLKALDFKRVFESHGPLMQVLEELVTSHNFEVSLLERCATKRSRSGFRRNESIGKPVSCPLSYLRASRI